jgi:hypothetical protein
MFLIETDMLYVSELIEAALYLYQATKDPYLLEIGVDMLEAIEHISKTKCGYATVSSRCYLIGYRYTYRQPTCLGTFPIKITMYVL